MAHSLAEPIRRAREFIGRPKRNFRVAIARAAGYSFLAGLTTQYDSIYTVALRANPIQLGSIGSIGSAVGALVSAPVGWLADRYGIKELYVLGIGLMAGAMVVYATAPDWRLITGAVMLISIAVTLTGTGCSVICADSLRNEDRATGKNLCVTLSSTIGLLAPIMAAFVVTASGGMNVEGIRPLYWIRFVGYGLVFLLVASQLQEPERMGLSGKRNESGFLHDFGRLFAHSTSLRRWILISSVSQLPVAMTTIFLPVFAHEVKGADQYVLAEMATAATAVYFVTGIPLGRLADRIGRKKVIYLSAPLWYASSLLLVWAPNTTVLVIAGALRAFYSVSAVATSAMALELVPLGQMGRWSGLLGLFGGLVAVPAPLIGGLIWGSFGPAYVFIVPIGVDLVVRIPLLSTIPETLHNERRPGAAQACSGETA